MEPRTPLRWISTLAVSNHAVGTPPAALLKATQLNLYRPDLKERDTSKR